MNTPSSSQLKFWKNLADKYIDWIEPYKTVLDESRAPFYKWFKEGQLNISALCIDRHLPQRANQTAILYDSEVGRTKLITYKLLSKKVNQLANLLKSLGVKKGDRVIIYMPMIPEAQYAMLACARIGAVHSVVFGGFSAEVLAERIIDTGAKLAITADGATRNGSFYMLKPTLDAALQTSAAAAICKTVVVVEHNKQPIEYLVGRDISYNQQINRQSGHCVAQPMSAEDPLFILYTSGSTGKPKGILHTHAGYILWAQYTMQTVFQLEEGDIFWCTADIGWITGHTYTTYGPLALGGTTLLFEGVPFYPDAGRYWSNIEKYKVTQFYTAPTALRMLRKFGPDMPTKYDLTSLKILGSVGEPIDPETWQWYYQTVGNNKCPIVDTWWQTETGGHAISPIPHKTKLIPGCATQPLPGIAAQILRHDGTAADIGEKGRLCITQPWPAMFRDVWGDHKRYLSYFDQISSHKKPVYFSGDGGFVDKDGNIHITGRVDDVLNISGHRIGAAEVEAALAGHPNIAESAIVGQPDAIKGERIFAFIVLKSSDKPAILRQELIDQINNLLKLDIGPFISVANLAIVPGLPKTRSGKVLRRILRSVANNKPVTQDISTLDNPNIVDEIRNIFNPRIALPIGYEGKLSKFDPEVAKDLAVLMGSLNEKWKDLTVTQKMLEPVFDSAKLFQLVIVEEHNGQPTVVGAANVSILQNSMDKQLRPVHQPTLWLDSMVAHPDVRGKGIGSRLWQQIIKIGKENGIKKLQFTSNACRIDAHAFYKAMGANQLGEVTMQKVKSKSLSLAANANNSQEVCDTAFEIMSGKFGIVFLDPNKKTPAVSSGLETTKFFKKSNPKISEDYYTVYFDVDVA